MFHLPSVAICEDNQVLRLEFERIIKTSCLYEVVGSSAYGHDIVDLLSKIKIDVLLLDLQLPDIHGLEVLAQASKLQPSCEVLIVTVFGDETTVLNAIEAGATGYLLKDQAEEQLLAMMRELLDGGSPITPSVARLLLRKLHKAPDANRPRISAVDVSWLQTLPLDLPFNWSEREDEVLMYVAKGYSVQEVADRLTLSANTIKTHVRRIYKKLSVGSRSEALHEARALGLLDRTVAGPVYPRART